MSHAINPKFKHLLYEAAMGNEGNANGVWFQLIAKHGPWAFGTVILGIAFYTFALQPMASERALFVQALQASVAENSKSWRAIADSTESIADSVKSQQATMGQLQALVTEMAAETMTTVTREKMEKFIVMMQEVHPKQIEMLKDILDKLESQ